MPLIASTGTRKAINFGLASSVFMKIPAIALAQTGSPFINVYPWDAGFGTRYANPSVMTAAGTSYGCSFNFTGRAISSNSSVGLNIYKWNSSGFGTRYNYITGSFYNTCFTPDNSNFIACSTSSTGGYAYPWNDDTGLGTKYADPVTAIGLANYSIAVSPDGLNVVYGLSASPNIATYKFSSLGYGTRFSDPSTVNTGYCTSVSFNSSGTVLAKAVQGSPYITVFPWSSTNGYGTKFTNPTTLPAGAIGYGVAFSLDNTTIACAHSTAPYLTVYPWNDSTGFGTKYADSSTAVSGACRSVDFSKSSKDIAVSVITTPFINAYSWDNGFGTKYSNPSTLPTASGNFITFSKY